MLQDLLSPRKKPQKSLYNNYFIYTEFIKALFYYIADPESMIKSTALFNFTK